jgi:hypothetical protein
MPYSKAVIYKIYNIDEPEKFYVGSTANSIWRRLYTHKVQSKISKAFFYTEINRLGWDKFNIEVIENFPCNNKQELFAEEERIRSETNAYYNTNRAYLTEEQRKEWIKEYDKKRKDYFKNYRDEHKEHYKNYRDEHKEETKEYDKRYRDENKEKIKKRKAKYYKKHREQILEKMRKRKAQFFS